MGDKNSVVKIIGALVVLVVLVVGALTLYSNNKKEKEETAANTREEVVVDGEKDASKYKGISIEVVNMDGTTQVYGVETDKQYLGEVLKEVNGLTVEGDITATGLYVKTVNGVYADYYANQTYWAFYVNDQYCQTGVDSQPVADGDRFKIAQVSGYVQQ